MEIIRDFEDLKIVQIIKFTPIITQKVFLAEIRKQHKARMGRINILLLMSMLAKNYCEWNASQVNAVNIRQ